MKIIHSSWTCIDRTTGHFSEQADSLSEYIFKVRRAIRTADHVFIYDENENLEAQIDVYYRNDTDTFDYYVYRKIACFSVN